MSVKYQVPIDMQKLEILQMAVHNLGSAPSSPVDGQIYKNTVDGHFYGWDAFTSSWLQLDGAGGSVTSVTGTAPIVSSGGSTPAISINPATGSLPGSMSAADKTKLDAATAAPTSSTLALRDSSGRLQVSAPSAGGDAANKTYVDNLINGASWGPAVVLVATSNIASLSGATTAIDGITATAGMRVLLTAQTTGAENGPWVVAAGAWTRPVDYPTATNVPLNLAYFVERGTAKHDTGWTLSSDSTITVDSTASAWTQFTGLGEVTAGNGLTKSGDTISALAADSTVTINGSGIAVTSPKLKFTATIGDGAATSYVITHSLNTRDVDVQVYRNSSPWDTVMTDVERTSTTTITVKFATPPTTNQFNVVILG